jgi:hypothetical protein
MQYSGLMTASVSFIGKDPSSKLPSRVATDVLLCAVNTKQQP